MRKKQFFILGLLIATIFAAAGLLWQGDVKAQGSDSTADHSKFEELQKEFGTGPEVTAACLECHTEAATQLHQTLHWNWEAGYEGNASEIGKKQDINNFCIAVQSNERRCTSCHIGYGWKDNEFDFTKEESVDCLVCHDTTGTYKKFPPGAGHPVYEEKEFNGKTWKPLDLTNIAQNVGATSRNTCGSCHFSGGGADGVKHGDLDTSLKNPDHSLDVHMASGEGELNFSCATCHSSLSHDVAGSRVNMTVTDREISSANPNQDHASCMSCHDDDTHEDEYLNNHTDRVACQTCHIPRIARGDIPTKVFWDWRDAGKDIEPEEQFGHETFMKKKGSFEYNMDFEPEYVWFNGTMRQTVATDKINPTKLVQINTPHGSVDDPDSRIYPMKVMHGFQPYDSVNNTFVIPHLMPYAGDGDTTAFWKFFEWGPAIEEGMRYSGLDYSGEYDFVETEMFWPIDHMVAPADEAVQCQECHDSVEGGRLDFAALGYSDERIQELTWEGDYPPITEDALDELVSKPSEGTGWIGWLLGIIGVGALLEVLVARKLRERRED